MPHLSYIGAHDLPSPHTVLRMTVAETLIVARPGWGHPPAARRMCVGLGALLRKTDEADAAPVAPIAVARRIHTARNEVHAVHVIHIGGVR